MASHGRIFIIFIFTLLLLALFLSAISFFRLQENSRQTYITFGFCLFFIIYRKLCRVVRATRNEWHKKSRRIVRCLTSIFLAITKKSASEAEIRRSVQLHAQARGVIVVTFYEAPIMFQAYL